MEGYGLSSLGPTVGLSGLPDPMGDATARLEARRRQQVTDAGYPGAAADATNPFEGILSALGPTINERAVAAREAMRRGDMATANALNQSLALDFGQFLGSIKPIRAYHGSPHDFDRFSMDKIGDGEGAQAFGHGLYFAESEKVARSYKNKLAGPKSGYAVPMTLDGNPVTSRNWTDVERKMWEAGDRDGAFLARMLGDANRYNVQTMAALKKAYKDPRHRLSFPWDNPFGQGDQGIDEAFRALRERASWAPPRGRMYEVDIHADPERLLDLDAPMSRQTPSVRDAAMDAIARGADDVARASGVRGADVAAWVADSGDPIGMFPNAYKGAAFSAAMRNAGVPGIKYLDAGSRSAGDGSRNYVVFDDKLIEILRKYGIMAPVAGAGLGSLSLGDEEGM